MPSIAIEVAAVLLTCALGLGLTKPFFSLTSGSARFLWFSLSWGIGAGLSSVIWFLFCVVPHLPPIYAQAVEVAAAAALWWRAIYSKGAVQANRISGPLFKDTSRLTRVILGAGVVCLALSVTYGAMYTAVTRDGDWDAWAIWNLHARILFMAHSYWEKQLFQIGYSHPDYPLLLPVNIVRLWWFAGTRDPGAPILLSYLFGFSPIFVAVSALAVLKSWTHAGIAALVLLGTSSFMHLAISQLADPAVSLYIVTTFVLLLASRVFQQPKLLYLAGLTAGFTAWVKNEGQLFLVALAIASIWVFRHAGKPMIRELLKPIVIGLVPALLCLAVFKKQSPAPSDVMSWVTVWSHWTKAFRGSRIALLLKHYGNHWWKLERWTIPPLLWLVILIDTTGLERGPLLVRNARRGLLVMAVMFVGYSLIYLTAVVDLTWYLSTSLERLILQQWPALIFFTVLLARDPLADARPATENEVSRHSETVHAPA